MKGRIWLLLGVAVGIAIGVGHLPYFAGAARSLSDTSQRIVASAGSSLVHSVAKRGWLRRLIEGLSALLGLLVPGATALLLVAAARFTLHLRLIVGLVVLVIGIASFGYLAHGLAIGTVLLALGAAAIVVMATGPLVAAPLAALAALIGTEFLPRLVSGRTSVSHSSIVTLHRALFMTAGSPIWLELVMLAVAAVPFAIAARLVIR